jgi:hypothetical protein
MAEQRGSVADEAAALRLRLYRPDPPAGALDAYLGAVARLPAVATPVPVAPRPVPRARPAGRLRALAFAAAVLAGLVTLGVAIRAVPAPAAVLPQPVAAPPSAAVDLPPVPGTVIGVLSGTRTGGLALDAGGHPVVVSVLCSGSGTLTLRIATDPPTVLTCQAGTSALALVPSAGPLGRFALAIAPDGRVRWSLAAAAQDSPRDP